MLRCNHWPFVKTTILIICFSLFLIFTGNSSKIYAKDPEFFDPSPGKPFIFSLGLGYGISNNPSLNSNDEKILKGITFSGTLGYRLGKRFMVDFGPVIWVKSEDIFRNELPSGERTSNKRMLVSFNGYYLLHKKFPLTLKLGAGVGSLVYSPERATVSADGKKNDPTEYFSGPAATGAVIYKFKLSDKITLHPSMHFWYTDLKDQKIEYVSGVDHQQPSITSDFRIQMFLHF